MKSTAFQKRSKEMLLPQITFAQSKRFLQRYNLPARAGKKSLEQAAF